MQVIEINSKWPTATMLRLVICNEEVADGRARVTADDEQVLHVD